MTNQLINLRGADIKVGPIDNYGYGYRIGVYVSKHRYHNSASAWADARRDQRISGRFIEPIPEGS